jgi:hypothetical protein
MRPRLCSLLGVAIELPELPLSFGAAIRRMGSFVLVALAHSMQSPFASGVSAPVRSSPGNTPCYPPVN